MALKETVPGKKKKNPKTKRLLNTAGASVRIIPEEKKQNKTWKMFQQICFLEDHCTKRDERRSFLHDGVFLFFFSTKTVKQI